MNKRLQDLFFVIVLIISFRLHSRETGHVLEIACSRVQKSKRQSPKQERGKVIGIKDGDTFELLINGRQQVVRLAHIDCPEKKQPFGSKAKQYASKLCFGKRVLLKHNSKYDRNKRLIAEIIIDGQNVNKELVKAGLAWHFKRYSDDKEYAALERKARQQRIGLWQEARPLPPWQWRKPSVREQAR